MAEEIALNRERKLQKIIDHGEMESLIEFLEQHPKALETLDAQGELPLHWAASEPPAAHMIDFMIQRYFPAVHTKNFWGQTPIHVACRYGNESGCKAFLLATQKWVLHDIWILESTLNPILDLANFASIETIEDIVKILKSSPNPNVRTKIMEILNPSSLESDTLLHRGLTRPDADSAIFIRGLIRMGVMTFQHTVEKQTPFELAISTKQMKSAKILAAADAVADDRNSCLEIGLSKQEITDIRASLYLPLLTAQLVEIAIADF